MKLDKLEMLVAPIRESVSRTIEYPEAAVVLDIASRIHDQTRHFKYLHQMCTVHALNFVAANKINQVALIDGYMSCVKAQCPLGPYLYGRSLLELAAFVFDISRRLSSIAEKPAPEWKSKGEEFFSILIRARFGTSNSTIRDRLINAGMPSELMRPFRIMKSMETLSQSKEGKPLADKYEVFCDYVHHNLSCQFTSSPGFRLGTAAQISDNGMIVTKSETPITRYTYPIPEKTRQAMDDTLLTVTTTCEAISKYLDQIFLSPFTTDEILAFTGHQYGCQILPRPSPARKYSTNKPE